MHFWAHVRKTARGGYTITIPAQIARDIMKDRSLLELAGLEVKVEVSL